MIPTVVASLFLTSTVWLHAEPAATRSVAFTTTAAEKDVPESFHLTPHTFSVEQTPLYDLTRSGVRIDTIRFPSPVQSADAVNNTVYCELFQPKKPGRYPGVIVLDIMDGRQVVSRGEALWLAQHDIAALVVIMPYYGPRRPTEGRHRMVTPDIPRTVENVRQAVLDCRRATAVLANLPNVDPERLGVLGTSLGSFIGAVVAAAEPRLQSACLLLGGGGLVDAYWNHPKAASITPFLALVGVTRATVARQIAPIDPITYAPQLKTKRLLLIAARQDDVVPPQAMQQLWEATGKQKLLWLDATHVGAAAYAFPAMQAVIAHIQGRGTVEGQPGKFGLHKNR
ncbi:MAG: acetylxylan esterase [Bacteroidales bacterium]|nr:acetylxylan esterase [Bacteroidales bacterium]